MLCSLATMLVIMVEEWWWDNNSHSISNGHVEFFGNNAGYYGGGMAVW